MNKIIIFAAVCLLSPLFAFAQGDSNGGKISSVTSYGDVLVFTISGNKESDRPDCATTKRFAAPGNSTHAPLIIAAYESGKKLGNVHGLDTCTQWYDAEDVKWIEVVQ